MTIQLCLFFRWLLRENKLFVLLFVPVCAAKYTLNCVPNAICVNTIFLIWIHFQHFSLKPKDDKIIL